MAEGSERSRRPRSGASQTRPDGSPTARTRQPRSDATVRRLDEPLRVAIAGRVKAGKSTLLNALVGERLAATDAGECTRIVTWYRHALGYRVDGRAAAVGLARTCRSGARTASSRSTSTDGPSSRIERIDVGWPSRKLTDLTLIDTPGLASANERHVGADRRARCSTAGPRARARPTRSST